MSVADDLSRAFAARCTTSVEPLFAHSSDSDVGDALWSDSESDWSDAQDRESDGVHDASKAPSAAQGGGRPWAHASRAKRRARHAARVAKRDACGGDDPKMDAQEEGGDGTFLSELSEDVALEVLKWLTPKDIARVACTRKSEMAMLTDGDSEVAASVWGRVTLRRGDDAAKALATVRSLAKTTLKELDVSGSGVKNLKRADLIETLGVCARVTHVRACDLGDVGKLTTKDVTACLDAAPSVQRMTCDLGHKIVYDPIRRDPTAKYIDVYDDNVKNLVHTLENEKLRVRRLKLHSADPSSVRAAAIASAANGPNKVESFDASWSLRIANEGANAVAECLAQGWDVKRLAIRKAAVSDEGAANIAEAIKRAGADGKSQLRWLDLGSNDIRGPGACAIGDAIGSPGVNLTRVTLRGNGIQFDSLSTLGRGIAMSNTLRRIDLAHNGFGNSGVLALAEGLSKARAPNLRVILLGFNSIGAEGVKGLMAALADTEVEHLDLACNVVGSDGAVEIAKVLNATKLKSLNLAVNNIGVRGERAGVQALSRALEGNQTLEILNLRGNAISKMCAGDLADLLLEDSALIQLNVGYNELYDHGAWEIAEALEDNTTILGVDMQRNEITDEGASCLLKTLELNTVLQEIDLRSNMISPECLTKFEVFGDKANCRWQLEPPKKKVVKPRRGGTK